MKEWKVTLWMIYSHEKLKITFYMLFVKDWKATKSCRWFRPLNEWKSNKRILKRKICIAKKENLEAKSAIRGQDGTWLKMIRTSKKIQDYRLNKSNFGQCRSISFFLGLILVFHCFSVIKKQSLTLKFS